MSRIEWPGEDDFGGYIAYASFSKVDYRQAEGKVCILYGHGAFTIENAWPKASGQDFSHMRCARSASTAARRWW